MSEPGLKAPGAPLEPGPRPQLVYMRPTPIFNGWAVAALIAGILGAAAWLMGFGIFALIGSVSAVLLGLDGISKVRKKNGGQLGLAITGLILGAIPTLVIGYAFLKLVLLLA